MCDKCISKEHYDFLKQEDIQNWLKKSMTSHTSHNNQEWKKLLANRNG